MKKLLAAALIILSSCSSQPQSIEENGEYFVTNPSSGSQTFLKVLSAGESSPTLFLIPGGEGTSRDFLTKKKDAQVLVEKGFTVVLFDPEGRGQSEGEEDYNGFTTQDGLAEVIEFAKTLPEVDQEKMGIVSFSYGVTMASGLLTRYPDIGIDFLIDWEGPIDRNDTGGCDEDKTGHIMGIVECDDEEFWSEREALTFIKDIEVPYWRIQSQVNHAHPDPYHAIRIVNAAIEGKSPLVKLNDFEPNIEFDEQNPPGMLPEKFDRELMERIADYAMQLGT